MWIIMDCESQSNPKSNKSNMRLESKPASIRPHYILQRPPLSVVCWFDLLNNMIWYEKETIAHLWEKAATLEVLGLRGGESFS